MKRDNLEKLNYEQLEIYYKVHLLEICETTKPEMILEQFRKYEKQTNDLFVDSWLQECKEKGLLISDLELYKKVAKKLHYEEIKKFQEMKKEVDRALKYRIKAHYQQRLNYFEELNEVIMQEQEELAEEEVKEQIRRNIDGFCEDHDLHDDEGQNYLNEENLKEFGLSN